MNQLSENETLSKVDIIRQVNELARLLERMVPDINKDVFGKSVPKDLFTGKLAYANGTDWNPGSGAGWYYYNGSSWTKLG